MKYAWQTLVLVGLILGFVGLFIIGGLLGALILCVGWAFLVGGCMKWVKEKNRNSLFALFGLLLIVIACLRDKKFDTLLDNKLPDNEKREIQ
jgi:uncharacterized membrane protein